MRVAWNPRLVTGRRLAGWASLVLLLLLLLRLPGRETPPPANAARPRSPALPSDRGISGVEMGVGQPLHVNLLPSEPPQPEPPPPPPPAPPTQPPVEPVYEPPPPVAELAEALALAGPAADSSASTGVPDAPDESLEPAEMSLRPRQLVHPRVPAKVTKRKINDSVLLKALIGNDGHVRQVVVLKGIPECDECTQSAIEAVEQYVYDAPMTGAVEVWTTPIEIRFSHGR